MEIDLQVHECKYAFRSFDKCGRNPNIRRVVRCCCIITFIFLKMIAFIGFQCKSFEMWSSKHEIRYSAFNIFDMDAKMYFNVMQIDRHSTFCSYKYYNKFIFQMACGVVSASLILTQVQMILDGNAAMNARKNNL